MKETCTINLNELPNRFQVKGFLVLPGSSSIHNNSKNWKQGEVAMSMRLEPILTGTLWRVAHAAQPHKKPGRLSWRAHCTQIKADVSCEVDFITASWRRKRLKVAAILFLIETKEILNPENCQTI
jgi:hypothetical protein